MTRIFDKNRIEIRSSHQLLEFSSVTMKFLSG